MRGRSLVLTIAMAGCGGSSGRAAEVTPAPTQEARRVETRPCHPVQRLGEPPVIVLGGDRDHQVIAASITTLDSGDGVLLSTDGKGVHEVSWWRDGACLWRSELADPGLAVYPSRDGAWVCTSRRLADAREEWSEVDADGRILRTFRTDDYVRAVVPRDDGGALVLSGLTADHTWWDADTGAVAATVSLNRNYWAIASAESGAPPAVLVTSSNTPIRSPNASDPHVVLEDGRVVRIGEGAAFGGAIRAMPEGGWLAAYSVRSSTEQRVVAVRIGARGEVVATATSVDLGEHAVSSIDADGISIHARAPAGDAWLPRRLHVGLRAGALSLSEETRGARWVTGPLVEAATVVNGSRVEVESWEGDNAWMCRVATPPCAPPRVVARGVYLLPPAR